LTIERKICHRLEKPYIAWGDNDDSTTSSSSENEEEEAKLCLMARYESSTSQVGSTSFKDEKDYYQLLHVFEKLHDEANRFSCLK